MSMLSTDKPNGHFPYTALLFDTVPIGIVFQGHDGTVGAANPAAQEMIGLSLEQLRGIAPVDERFHTVHEDGSPWPFNEHPGRTALRTGQTVREVMGIFKPSISSYTWIRIVATPVFGSDKKRVKGVYAIFEDITERKATLDELAESRQRLELATQHTGVGIWDSNPRTGKTIWNETMYSLYGVRHGEFTGDADYWLTRVHADDRERTGRERRMALDSGKPREREFRILWPNGEVRYLRSTSKVLRDGEGKPVRVLGTTVDVTERRLAEERLHSTLESIGDAFVAFDRDWRYDYVNDQAERLIGMTREELIGRVLWEVLPGALGTPREISYRKAAEGVPQVFEHYYEQWGRWFQVRCFPRTGGGITVYFVDLSERKRLESALERQAHFDFLTGLASRAHFMELAESELARAARYGEKLSILMMDIDHFKQINDSHGHKVGDRVLKRLAEVCRETLRSVDIAGRIGGEEFAVLLPETDPAEALEVAERLRAAIAAASVPMEHGLPVKFSVSIGVTSVAPVGDDVGALLDNADRALYAAKNAGRNRVVATRLISQ